MAIPKHIVDYHNTREAMAQEVREDTNIILEAIDLDEMLADPRTYLTQLGVLFMERNNESFVKALDLGRKHGKKMSNGI